jgi:O-antigen/teichoic acid export membrane protein
MNEMSIAQQISVFVRKPALKSAGIYTFSNFFSKSIGFFLLFIYSNPVYLNVDENGLLSLLASSTSIFIPFLSMGVVHSTSVEFFKLDKKEFKDFFTTGFVMPLIVLFLGIGILYYFKTDLQKTYDFPTSFVFIIPVIAFLTFCSEMLVTLIRSKDEPVMYLKVSMLRLAIEASLSLLLVISFTLRWKGRVSGMMAGAISTFILAFFYFRKNGYLFGKIKKKYLKSDLIYAIPIIIFQGGSFCLFSSDKFFLSSFGNNSQVGVYSYACTFSTILNLGCTAVLSYVLPKIYQQLSSPRVDYKQIRNYFFYYFSFALFMVAAILAVTPFLYKHFINERYYEGLSYLYFIVIGYFFWNITYFFYSFLLYKKQKRKLIGLSFASITISLISNYIFIKNFSAQGAAISVCISFFLVFIITLLTNSREAKLIIIDGIFNRNEI